MNPALLALAGTLAAGPIEPLPAHAHAGSEQVASSDDRALTLGAMQAELARSMERLRLKGYEAPYYLAYQLKDVIRHQMVARFGAIFEDDSRRDRTAYVDVRVGSYDFDSSGDDDVLVLFGQDAPSWTAPKEAPLDGDPIALRNALWLETDERYKDALSSYFKKKSREVFKQADLDRSPSFSREEPVKHRDAKLAFPFDEKRWKATAQEATLLFRNHPDVFDASLKIQAEKQTRWFTSSEGHAIITEEAVYGIHLTAVTRAPDGQLLEDGRDYYAHTEAALPTAEDLRAAVGAVAEELEALRKAPVIDPYTGPAILEPEATGVLFHEAVGHRLEGERLDDDREGQTFKGQVGRTVLPSFLSIIDDPTLSSYEGVGLNGVYEIDEQGVPAQRTVLVRDGKLLTYLLSRRPVKPFTHSNGHGRSQGPHPAMARMSNLIIESTKRVPLPELKKLLMAEARRQGKPYGLIIGDITGGNTNTMSFGYQAFKGTPRLVWRVDAQTGVEELVRGVELVGTPLTSVNKVIATGDTSKVFNGFCGAESGYVPVSTVAPSSLVGEIELERIAKANDRPPLLPAPWSETPAAPDRAGSEATGQKP